MKEKEINDILNKISENPSKRETLVLKILENAKELRKKVKGTLTNTDLVNLKNGQ